MSATSKSKGLLMVNSQSALAKAIGVARSVVQKWLKDDRWLFGDKGPWPVEAIKRWRKKTLKSNPDDEDENDITPTSLAKYETYKWRAALLELSFQRESGKVIDAEQAEYEKIMMVLQAHKALMSLAPRLDRVLQKTRKEDFRTVLDDEIRNILYEFAGDYADKAGLDG